MRTHPDWNRQTAYMQLRKLEANGFDHDATPRVVSKETIVREVLNLSRIHNMGLITTDNFLIILKDLLSGV